MKLRSFLPTLLSLLLVFSLQAQKEKAPAKVKLENSTDSVSYAFGLMVAKNLMLQGVEEINYGAFESGFHHMMVDKKPKITPEDAHLIIQAHIDDIRRREAMANKAEGQEFLEKNSREPGVVVLGSGLQYKVIESGKGKSPGPDDMVKVHYEGTLIDGTVFDSSYERDEPAVFNVGGVIRGWQEALTLMRPGSKWMLYIPPGLAYGERGAGDHIGPNATLIFEVELLEVMEKRSR